MGFVDPNSRLNYTECQVKFALYEKLSYFEFYEKKIEIRFCTKKENVLALTLKCRNIILDPLHNAVFFQNLSATIL